MVFGNVKIFQRIECDLLNGFVGVPFFNGRFMNDDQFATFRHSQVQKNRLAVESFTLWSTKIKICVFFIEFPLNITDFNAKWEFSGTSKLLPRFAIGQYKSVSLARTFSNLSMKLFKCSLRFSLTNFETTHTRINKMINHGMPPPMINNTFHKRLHKNEIIDDV